MRPRSLLVLGAVLVALVIIGGALLAPGVLADPEERAERPGRVTIEELTVSPGQITGDTATLVVDTHLTHRGGPADNVTVLLRAVDSDTGFKTTTRQIDVGAIESEGEVVSTANLTVERSGGYRLEVVLYQDGRRLERGVKTVSGLEALTPAYARTDVQFHRFQGDDLPAIEFTVAEAGENRTTLEVSTYLTNQGEAAGGLELDVVARQADSNIIADRSRIRIGSIESGETVTPSTELTVPSDYNYYLDAILWKDGVIVGDRRSVANLDPTRQISVNETTEDVGLEVSDFEREERPPETPAEEPSDTETESPGFGIGAVAIALGASVLLFRRRFR